MAAHRLPRARRRRQIPLRAIRARQGHHPQSPMRPNSYIAVLKEYPVVSHKAWEYADKSDILKLDWNEADMELAPPIKDALIRHLEEGKANWYPDVANKELLRALASYAGVPDTH